MGNVQFTQPPDTSDCTSDLSQWYHCSNNRGLPDTVISKAWEVSEKVSFIFHHRSNSAVAEAEIAKEEVAKKRLKELEEAEDEKENRGKKKRLDSDEEDYEIEEVVISSDDDDWEL